MRWYGCWRVQAGIKGNSEREWKKGFWKFWVGDSAGVATESVEGIIGISEGPASREKGKEEGKK